MALITRLTRLLRADLHAVLDRLEEPEILLAQSIREMEQAVTDDRSDLAALREQQARLDARRVDSAQRRQAIDEELALCLDADQDDLARTLLRRRLESERTDRLLEVRRQELDTRACALEARLAERAQRLDAVRAEAELLVPPASARGGQRLGHETLPERAPPIGDAEVEVALLAAKRRRPA